MMRSLPFAASPPRRAPPENVVADHAQIHVLGYSLTRGVTTPTHYRSTTRTLATTTSRGGGVEAVTAGAMQEPRQSRSLEPSHSYPEQDATGLNQPAQGPAASSRATGAFTQAGDPSASRQPKLPIERAVIDCAYGGETPGRTRHPIRSRRALPIRGVPILIRCQYIEAAGQSEAPRSGLQRRRGPGGPWGLTLPNGGLRRPEHRSASVPDRTLPA